MPITNDEQARKIAQAIANQATPQADKAALRAALVAYDQQSSNPVPAQPGPSMNDWAMRNPNDMLGPELNAQQGQEVAGNIGRTFARAPLTAAEGMGQMATFAGMKAGAVSPDTYKAYNEAVTKLRADAEAKGTNMLGSEIIAGLVPVGGQAALVSKVAPKLGYLGSLAKGAVTGAAMGGSVFDEGGDDKVTQMAWGAAFPAAAQAVVGAGRSIHNYIANSVNRVSNERVADTVARAKDFFRGSSVAEPSLTPAQATGNPVIAALEQRARGASLRELGAKQRDAVSDRFDELAEASAAAATKVGTAPGATGIAGGAYHTVDKLDQDVRSLRRAQWNDGMEEVKKLSTTSTSGVGLTNLKKAYESILASDANAFNFSGGILPQNIKDTFETLGKLPPSLRLRAPGVQTVLQGLSQDIPRGSAIVDPKVAKLEAYRTQLLKALDADLAGAGVATDPAFAKLAAVRKQYAQTSDKLREIEDSNLNAIFGDKSVLASPDAAVTRLLSLAPEDRGFALKTLTARAPGVVDAMRAFQIRKALDAAHVDSSAVNSTFDLDKFQQSLFKGREGLVNADLFGPELSKVLRSGAAYLKLIQNADHTLKGGGSVVWPEEIAINVVSRSPEFIARTATRLAYGMKADKLFGTPEGLKALRTLVPNSAASAQAKAQAVAWMLSQLQDESAPQ